MLKKSLSWISNLLNKREGNYFSKDSSEFERIKALEKILDYKIENPHYYLKALTHRSYIEISSSFEKSNERLEFLGDSVLGMIVAENLFNEYPENDEGFLTKSRSRLVDKEALTEAADRLNLTNLVLYDKRYIRGSTEGLKTIAADCLEALIAAIFLDAGLGEARQFVEDWIIIPNLSLTENGIDKNYKGQLLEYTHANKLSTPLYFVKKEEGPDHNKFFLVEVKIGYKVYGEGKGKSKKSAEQKAAQKALELINSEELVPVNSPSH
ncbi:MAG: ribonuclease III [Bacteroidetes bacterium]|nr:ribonuclease III [Bacteroidota bacterium]MBU1677698.1 ribonuclease III [Bacteroidota bacterium]MBU2505543.1 ribonuclease III [Bacteroidota bacterium]